MKRFALLRLLYNANTTVGEVIAGNRQDAVKHFQYMAPVTLDADGYAKVGEVSFCVAECFDPQASCYELYN